MTKNIALVNAQKHYNNLDDSEKNTETAVILCELIKEFERAEKEMFFYIDLITVNHPIY